MAEAMINETLFLGECPIIRPEGIYYGGRRVIALDPGLQGVGVGDVGDLIAYRREWEPFIAAHLELWRNLNEVLEATATAQQKCPAGIFTSTQVKDLDATSRVICTALSLSRARTSTTDPGGGILPQWNAWKDKSSADMVAGAASMLQFHQSVVMRVGGDYAKELLEYSKYFGVPIQLPDLPSFSVQQEIRARIEGAYITTKGVIQLVGYGVGEVLGMAADVAQATAKGLTDTAKALPGAARWVGITLAVAVAVVGGALIVYYVPKHSNEPQRI
jgi:hypothetical protein